MSSTNNKPINSTVIRQLILLAVIVGLLLLLGYNLSMFIPSVLGALTLYIVSRKYLLYLIEVKKWKPFFAALLIILATLVIVIIPFYFFIDLLVDKLGNAEAYMNNINYFVDKVHGFVYDKLGIDLLSKENLDKLKVMIPQLSKAILNTTVNTATVIVAMYFLLYFILVSPRKFESIVSSLIPLKKSNRILLGEKIKKMVIANAVGIPVVALGQAIIALIGYFIFGAPNPLLLFVLTFFASMIPIVGAAIVYVPVCIFMVASGQLIPGIALCIYSLVVVGLTDNVLRFTVLKKLDDIHPLITVFGIIAGMDVFGFLGLIFGPILISITILLIKVYKDEFGSNGESQTSSPSQNEAS